MTLFAFSMGLLIGSYLPRLVDMVLGERPRRMSLDEILATIPPQSEK